MPQCKRIKRDGQQCRRYAVTGSTVCQVHGAGSPGKGRPGGRPAITGRRSKYLPVKLAEKYHAALSDPNLLELRDEIALIDARLNTVLQTVDNGAADTAEVWGKMERQYTDLMAALTSIPALTLENVATINTEWRGKRNLKVEKVEPERAPDQVAKSIREMGSLITAGIDQRQAWEEIQALVEQRRKLVESERKWYIENEQIITAKQGIMLMAAIADIIKTNVTDPQARQAIIEGINRLTLIESGQ